MKIVIGMPVAERAWVLPDWFAAVEAQRFPLLEHLERTPVQVEVLCLYTNSRDRTLQTLENHRVSVMQSMLPTRSYERIANHSWGVSNHEYEYMASLRNTLRKEVLLRDADYFLSLDSDIILPDPLAIESMIICAQARGYDAVSPLVNMVSEPGFDPHYNWMFWASDGFTGARALAPVEDEAFDVGIIMAAMLLNKKAQCIPWANHHQGEDLGWSLNARRSNLKLGVVPWVKCDHKMRIHG